MRQIGGAAIMVILGAIAAFPAAAQDTDFAAQTDEELLAIFQRGPDTLFARPCEIGVPLTAELLSRHPDDTRFQDVGLFAQAFCADMEGDYRNGLRLMPELAHLAQTGPQVDHLTLYFLNRLEDGTGILAQFRAMGAQRTAAIDDGTFWPLVSTLRKDDLEDDFAQTLLDWQDAGGLESFDEEIQGPLAVMAVRAATEQGRLDAVPPMLAMVRSPDSYITMLADRRYAPAWPQIEQRAGEHLATASQDYVQWALTRLEANESDRDRFSTAARALLYAGRFENAVALAQRWRDREGSGAQIEEGDAWALNLQAYAYDALGEPEKADGVFDDLARLDPGEHPWVINFLINRASRLVDHGRWEEGLAAADAARGPTEDHGTTYAKMLIARGRVCALSGLGRMGEAEDDLAFMRENSDATAGATAQALMCAGEREEAAAALIDGLEREASRATVVADLQAPAFDLFYTPSVLPQTQDLLAESEPLTQAFQRYGRVIPERFTPVASQNRKRWLKAD